MARIVALEWDSRLARIVVGNLRTSDVLVEEMFLVELSRPSGEGERESRPSVGRQIAEALSARRVGRGPAVVALGRSTVEMKQLTLPPAPDEELPQLVAMQSIREFTSLGEGCPLDFVPLDHDPQEQRHVLAAAARPDAVKLARGVCQESGLELARLGLRPFASASLFSRFGAAQRRGVQLLIDLTPDDADLTVLADGQVVFTRTARLPGDLLESPGESRALIGELRRSLPAVHNQLGERRVETVFVHGATAAHETIAGKIQQDLGLPCQTVDPLASVVLASGLQSNRPAAAERYAALLGLLMDEAAKTPPAVDFLHPRQAPPPASRKRTWSLMALAAGLLVLLVGGIVAYRLYALNRDIAAKQREMNELKHEERKIKAAEDRREPIDRWQGSAIVWLDELNYLSRRLPSPDESMLTSLSMRSIERNAARRGAKKENEDPRRGGGIIEITGLARDPSVLGVLLPRLRDARHDSTPRRVSDEDKHPLQEMYRARFGVNVLAGRKPPDYRPARPAETK